MILLQALLLIHFMRPLIILTTKRRPCNLQVIAMSGRHQNRPREGLVELINRKAIKQIRFQPSLHKLI